MADEPTIRGTLSDAVNEINNLLIKGASPEEEAKLRRLRRIYFALWEEVIRQQIDHNTYLYREAIESLKEATGAATAALEDIKKVAEAINKAVSAAKAVDKVVKLGIDLLA